ncbi:MAG: uridine kinase [Bacteroidetes bacterium]|nr:uridine kinase [Bacteroidota bacterium]
MESIIIGIAGGSGSGKTTVVRRIMEKFTKADVAVMSQDSYYRDNAHLTLEQRQLINFDHPASIEFELIVQHLSDIKAGKTIAEPTYDYITSTRQSATIPIEPRHVVIIEGILLFTDVQVRDLCNIKVFVDAEPDDRLIRIIHRDMHERGRNVDDVIERYGLVKKMHDQFIEPTKKFADIIVPQGGENHVAIDVLVSMIRQKLSQKVMVGSPIAP